MSTSSDSAEEIVRLSLEGFEVVAKLSGSMAKNLAVMLYAISKDTNKKTKGRTRLTNMLKSNSNLTIFSIKKEDYKDFKKEAKRYGILYCAVFNKNSKTSDGLVDLVIREEDSVRVNRVVERYNITKVDVEKVEKELDETNTESTGNTEKPEIEKDIQEMNTSDELLNKLLKKQNIKEVNENSNPSNLPITEKETQLENSSQTKKTNEGKVKEEKPSIHEKLENIKVQKAEEKAKSKEETKDIPKKEQKQEIKHKQPKKKNRKKRGEK